MLVVLRPLSDRGVSFKWVTEMIDFFDKILMCQTKLDGRSVAGKFLLSEEGIKVKLVDFEGSLHLPEKSSLILELEDCRYATLLAKTHGLGSSWSETLSNSYNTITAYIAVVGFRPWLETDRIKSLNFTFSDSNEMLFAPDIRQKISQHRNRFPDSKIFEFSIDGLTITTGYYISKEILNDVFVTKGFYCNINFEDGKDISDIGEALFKAQTFFSFVAGGTIEFEDYTIETVHRDTGKLPTGSDLQRNHFDLVWPSRLNNSSKSEYSIRSYLCCWDKENREIFENCFSKWIASWPKWSKAINGLFISLGRQNNYDGDRLLNACKWLESTPGADQNKVKLSGDLNELIKYATEKANNLSTTEASRVKNALKNLSTESRNSLLDRLLERANRLTKIQNVEPMKKDIHAAFATRGKFAHSKFHFNHQDDFQKSVQQIQAVEALAFMLLIAELPLPLDFDRIPEFYPLSSYLVYQH